MSVSFDCTDQSVNNFKSSIQVGKPSVDQDKKHLSAPYAIDCIPAAGVLLTLKRIDKSKHQWIAPIPLVRTGSAPWIIKVFHMYLKYCYFRLEKCSVHSILMIQKPPDIEKHTDLRHCSVSLPQNKITE